jgi:hypothetical protein
MNKTFHANNINYNACVGFNGNYDIDKFDLVYIVTVNVLLESTIKGETTLDAIVYPVVYSARHYIELTLKHQIAGLTLINRIVDSNFNSRFLAIHEISELWKEFRLISKLDSRYEELVLKAEEYINDFSEIDDNGETFRYPFSNDNIKHLSGLYCIDLYDFGVRFEELCEILKEIVWLTSGLVEEYNQRSFIAGKSRAEIKEVAMKLPPIQTWSENGFNSIKSQIKTEYNLSSNQLSKIINFIKSHREFSTLIDNEIRLEELTDRDLIWFLKVYDEFILNRKKHDFFTYLHATIDKINRKFTKAKIASLAQLYDMGYFGLYSEEYDIGLNFKMKDSKYRLTRFYLLPNGIVKENIYRGLQTLGQKTLIEEINNYGG